MFIKFWKTYVWALIILILSGIPGSDLNKVDFLNIPHFDKIAHFGMYFILSFLLLFEYFKPGRFLEFKFLPAIIILLSCMFYGFIIEVLQHFIFLERSFDLLDFLANSIGSIFSFIFFITFKNKLNRFFFG